MNARIRSITSLSMFALATACASESHADVESSSGDTSGTTGVDVDALWDCSDSMVLEFRALAGPGYDPEMGGLLEPMQDSYVVAATRVWVPPERQTDFFALSASVTAQLDVTPGMVAYALASEPTCGFLRTLSAFRSDAAMGEFVTSDAHAAAMSRYSEFVVTGKFTAWTIAADEFPPSIADVDAQFERVEPL